MNRLLSSILDFKSPFEVLMHKQFDLQQLKVFGCLCYASTLTRNRQKLDARARKCIFIGYKFGTKGFLLQDIKTREIFLSRNVVFHEHTFPYQPSQSLESHETTTPTHDYHSFFSYF
ncbi:putative RNA-directed DNA polymerase [Lupinus albus]|uniref:Putative RNA-directed DNA polymerase n=1 Tax=Lupinus albus TaxID=3870 RepID=A0A6A4Q9A9_LUPAL|nr:putative RNA-directed DNA polymerase [Lupinus albus]